jgi:hypothetical protein
MKKYILSLIFLSVGVCKAQWVNKTSDNGFDDPYNYSICTAAENNRIWLKLEKLTDSSVLLYIFMMYVCKDKPLIDYSFKTDTGYFKTSDIGLKDDEGKRIYLMYELSLNNTLGNIWCRSLQLRIRISDGACGTDIYTFNMTGSASALRWVQLGK